MPASMYRNDQFNTVITQEGVPKWSSLSAMESTTVVTLINLLDQELQSRAADEAKKAAREYDHGCLYEDIP